MKYKANGIISSQLLFRAILVYIITKVYKDKRLFRDDITRGKEVESSSASCIQFHSW